MKAFSAILLLATASATLAQSSAFKCPANSDNNAQLVSDTVNAGGFRVCDYGVTSCAYFNQNGSFSSGSSECPDSLEAISAAPTTTAPAQASPPNFSCARTSNSGLPLSGSGEDAGIRTCNYNPTFCTYLADGSLFRNESSDCPSRLVTSAATTTTAAPKARVTQNLSCARTSNSGLRRTGSGEDAGIRTCNYNPTFCAYAADGSLFRNESSDCPSRLVASSSSRLSGAVENAQSETGSSSDYAALLRNSFIAIGLLAAVLIMLLILVVVIVGKGGLKGTPNAKNVRYPSVDAKYNDV